MNGIMQLSDVCCCSTAVWSSCVTFLPEHILNLTTEKHLDLKTLSEDYFKKTREDDNEDIRRILMLTVCSSCIGLNPNSNNT